jgi:protein-disulfide isomerase
VTHDVKTAAARPPHGEGLGARLETAMAVHYNLRVSSARISGHFILAVLSAPLLMGGACEKKPSKPADTGAVTALDHSAEGGNGKVDTTPLSGVDLGKLSGDKAELFYRLIGSLKSPCGKAHSLRTSMTSDTSCKRAPFAVRYVIALLEDEVSENDVQKEYAQKYEKQGTPVALNVSKAPHMGSDDARIRFVEFYDYECPHCQLFKPMMEQVLADKGSQISVSFMMFPIESKHAQSRSAAQAAIAASQQGKFKEMHDKLFEASPRHGREDVMSYAKEMGLDLAKFEKAYADASAQVTTDLKQGEDAGVDSTPTLFFNDRKYEGPMLPKYLEMWIDEEVAVNR